MKYLDGIRKLAFGTGEFFLSQDEGGNTGLKYYQLETTAGNYPGATPWFENRIPDKYRSSIQQIRSPEAYEASVFIPLESANIEDLSSAEKTLSGEYKTITAMLPRSIRKKYKNRQKRMIEAARARIQMERMNASRS